MNTEYYVVPDNINDNSFFVQNIILGPDYLITTALLIDLQDQVIFDGSLRHNQKQFEMVAIVAKAAASMATGIVAFASVRNMVETNSLMNDATATATANETYVNLQSISKSTDDIVQELQRMKRKDLIQLFLHCEAPSPKELDALKGSWDGTLLDNNSVLVSCLRNVMFI